MTNERTVVIRLVESPFLSRGIYLNGSIRRLLRYAGIHEWSQRKFPETGGGAGGGI